MKTYTIEQFKTYLASQASLGDIHYNLNKIDEILAKHAEVTEIEDDSELNDYLVDLESYQGEKFTYEGVTYLVSDDVTGFIREYGYDAYSQHSDTLESCLKQGLISEV
jgi:hypothetical protein